MVCERPITAPQNHRPGHLNPIRCGSKKWQPTPLIGALASTDSLFMLHRTINEFNCVFEFIPTCAPDSLRKPRTICLFSGKLVLILHRLVIFPAILGNVQRLFLATIAQRSIVAQSGSLKN